MKDINPYAVISFSILIVAGIVVSHWFLLAAFLFNAISALAWSGRKASS